MVLTESALAKLGNQQWRRVTIFSNEGAVVKIINYRLVVASIDPISQDCKMLMNIVDSLNVILIWRKLCFFFMFLFSYLHKSGKLSSILSFWCFKFTNQIQQVKSRIDRF